MHLSAHKGEVPPGPSIVITQMAAIGTLRISCTRVRAAGCQVQSRHPGGAPIGLYRIGNRRRLPPSAPAARLRAQQSSPSWTRPRFVGHRGGRPLPGWRHGRNRFSGSAMECFPWPRGRWRHVFDLHGSLLWSSLCDICAPVDRELQPESARAMGSSSGDPLAERKTGGDRKADIRAMPA